jgi:hypothetical protein
MAQTVTYVDTAGAPVNWGAAVSGGAATVDIYQVVSDGLHSNRYVWARAGQAVTAARVADAQASTVAVDHSRTAALASSLDAVDAGPGTAYRNLPAGASSGTIRGVQNTGEGVIYVDATGTETIDGGAAPYVVQPGEVAQFQSSGAGAWVRLLPGTSVLSSTYVQQGRLMVSVKDAAYGAIGDGVANDTAAIQAALTAVANAGGGMVYLPPGTYRITAGLLTASKVTLVGAGQSSLIKPDYPSAINFVIRNDYTIATSGVILRDFAIDRSGANMQHAVLLRNVDGILIDGLRIFGTPATVGGGINIGGFTAAPTVPSASEACSNVRVANCYLSGTDNFGIQLGAVTNATVIGNILDDCYREAIGVEPGNTLTATNVAIVGNSVTTGSTKVGGSTPTGAIVVTESSGGTVRNVTVSGNTVRAGAVIAGDANPGITVKGGIGVVIQGNTCRNLNGPGLSVGDVTYSTTYATITGNVVKDCNQGGNSTPDAAGIKVRGASKCLFSGNFVSGSAHNVALEETGGSGSNSVVGNYFIDNVSQTGTFGGNTTWWGNKVGTTGTVDVYTSLSFIDGRNIGIGSGTGTQIGSSGSKMGFYGATPVARPAAITGSRGGNAAVADLLTKLATLGLIVDSTSA